MHIDLHDIVGRFVSNWYVVSKQLCKVSKIVNKEVVKK